MGHQRIFPGNGDGHAADGLSHYEIPYERLYAFGTGCFIAGLLLSIFAGNFGIMMLGRVMQACGNGILMSAAQVIILTVYPAERRGSMMGTYGLATTAAPIIAPTVAGLMIDAFGWRSIFWLVMAIMTVSFVVSIMVFENVLELRNKKFDFLSFVESIFAFGGITLGAGNITAYGVVSVQAGLPLLVGVVFCALFVIRQCRSEKPLLDVKILNNRNYAVSVIASMVLYLVMMGSSVLMPLYVQSVMGYSAVVSGLVTLPGSAATALVSPFAGKLYDKTGIRKIFVTGAAALTASNAGMYFLTVSTPLWVAAALNVIRNISIGSLMMPLLTWGTSDVRYGQGRGCFIIADFIQNYSRMYRFSCVCRYHEYRQRKLERGLRASSITLMHGMNVSFLWMADGRCAGVAGHIDLWDGQAS